MADSHGPFAQKGLEALALKDGDEFLDIGCGSGYTLSWVKENVPTARVTGIDISPEMISLAKKNLEGLENVTLKTMDWPPQKNTGQLHDAIFSMEVFYYFSDLNQAISAVFAHLRPGGRFACLVDYYQEHKESHAWKKNMNLSMHLLSKEEWAYEFKRVGFKEIISKQITLPHKPDFVGTLMTLGAKGDKR